MSIFDDLAAIYTARLTRQLDAVKDWLTFCEAHALQPDTIRTGLTFIEQHRLYKIDEMKAFVGDSQ